MKNLKTLGILGAIEVLLVIFLFRTFGELAQLADINPTEPNSTMAVYSATTFLLIKVVVYLLGLYLGGVYFYNTYRIYMLDKELEVIKEKLLRGKLKSKLRKLHQDELNDEVKANWKKEDYINREESVKDNKETYGVDNIDWVTNDYCEAKEEPVFFKKEEVGIDTPEAFKDVEFEKKDKIDNTMIQKIVTAVSNLTEEELREEERYLALKPKKLDYVEKGGDEAYAKAVGIWKDTLPNFMVCKNTIVETYNSLSLNLATARVENKYRDNSLIINERKEALTQFWVDYNINQETVLLWKKQGYGC